MGKLKSQTLFLCIGDAYHHPFSFNPAEASVLAEAPLMLLNTASAIKVQEAPLCVIVCKLCAVR